MIIGGEIESFMILEITIVLSKAGLLLLLFLHSSWIFYSILQMMLKGGMA